MDIFDFGTDRTDGELEQALRDTLLRRSSDITAAAPLPSASERAALLQNTQLRKADPAPGGRRVTLLAAAVVLVLCGASALGVNALAHRHSNGTVQPAHSTAPRPAPSASASKPTKPSKPTTKAASCPLPQSWRTAIQAGVVKVDQPSNAPVSAGSDGSFLMQQEADSGGNPTHQELAIFNTQNHGVTIWTAADPVHDLVEASPDSAISANWVVYGLTRSQNLADHGVRAWNRQDGNTVDVRTLSAAEEAANLVIDISPIVVGNTAYWVERRFVDTTHETLVSQQLPSGARSTRPVSGVDRLVAVGGGVVVLGGVQGEPGHTFGHLQPLLFGVGVTVPQAVIEAGAGRMFVSDGSTLRWLTGSGAGGQLNSWRPGQAEVTRSPAAYAGTAWTALGPFIADTFGASSSSSQVLDTRNGRLVTLPSGWAFTLVAGGDLIVSTGNDKFGAADIRRVNVNSLQPATC